MKLEGGCYCGGVRYALEGAALTGAKLENAQISYQARLRQVLAEVTRIGNEKSDDAPR